MNAEIKARWLEALRSGKYQQGRYVLRTADNTYCCLGVLCDLLDPSKWTKGDITIPGGYYWQYEGWGGSLPLMAKTGLGADTLNRLIKLNDVGTGFEPIAQWIEENL